MAGATAEAVTLARVQLALLRAGDVDGFLAADAACAAACQAAVEAQETGPEARALLEELVALTEAIGTELGRRMDEATARMEELNRKRHASGAYLATPGGEGLSDAGY